MEFSLLTVRTDWPQPPELPEVRQSNRGVEAIEVGDEYVIKWVTDNNAT